MDINSQEHINALAPDIAKAFKSVEELTYTGVVSNHAGKERAKLVNKEKGIYVLTSPMSLLRNASVGDVFLVRVYDFQKRKIVLTSHPTDKKDSYVAVSKKQYVNGVDVCTVCGRVSVPGHGDFCFIDRQYFVPETLAKANNLKEGDTVKAKARKMPDGRWRVVSIIK